MKTNTLPENYDDQPADVQVLLADANLTRGDLLDRIDANVPPDLDTSRDRTLTRTGMARLYVTLSDTNRPPRFIESDYTKPALRTALADAAGIAIADPDGRGDFTKVELIRLWLVVSGRGNGADDRDTKTGLITV